MTATERFLSKIRRDPDTGCWLWTGATNSNGYGQIKVDGRTTYAHRFAYEVARGPVPAGMELDHLCSVRRCVRPSHLEAVDHRTNLLRGQTTTAAMANRNGQVTHCPQGHPYDEANTYRWGGRRHCKACHAARQRRRYHARKAARADA